MCSGRGLTAGLLLGLGAMFKGQLMLVAPMIIAWPMFDRQWKLSARVMVGIAIGIGAVAWPWLIHGSMAWARAGFASPGMYSDVLRKGVSQNLPAALGRVLHMTLHQHVIALSAIGLHVAVELKTVLLGVYFALLGCMSWGISRQARNDDPRFLASIAAPFAVMFFVLGQMDERYLVWGACLSAAAVAVNRWSLAAHVMLSFAGVVTMLEFLFISAPQVSPGMLHMLVLLNPLAWVATAAAVGTLLLNTLRSQRTRSAIVFQPSPKEPVVVEIPYRRAA